MPGYNETQFQQLLKDVEYLMAQSKQQEEANIRMEKKLAEHQILFDQWRMLEHLRIKSFDALTNRIHELERQLLKNQTGRKTSK